jgi:hypothetical protein
MTVRCRLACAALLVVTAALSACGSAGTRSQAIATVGHAVITKSALTHWMAALAPQHDVPDPPRYTRCIARQSALAPASGQTALKRGCVLQYRTLKRKALDLLISRQWLIGEAADDRAGVPRRRVLQLLREKERMTPGGEPGFREALAITARTVADVELEIEAELAAVAIRKTLMRAERRVSRAQVASYYKANLRHFRHRERRGFYIVEDLRSRSAALQRMREIRHGRNIASVSLPESLERSSHYLSAPSIVKAIFTAKPHVLVGPVPVNDFYYLIEVTRITPAAVKPLWQLQRSIASRLARQARRRMLARFIRTWRAKWIARTDCPPGYVVDKCRQYTGRRPREDPLSLT